MVFPFALLPLTVILGERGRGCFGAGAGVGVDGHKFQLSRWSQARAHQTAECEACFTFFTQ